MGGTRSALRSWLLNAVHARHVRSLVFKVCCFFNPCKHFSRTCLARKGFTGTNRRRSIGQRPGTKSGRRPADKLRVDRSLCSSIGLHKISFVRSSEEPFRTVACDALEGTGDGCPRGEPTHRRPVLPGPAPPRRPAVRPWHVWALRSGGRSTGGCSKPVLFPLPCNKPLELGRCVRTHWCKDTSQHEWLKGQARIEDTESGKTWRA